MRPFKPFFLLVAIAIIGCRKSSPQNLTPEQSAQVQAARQATVASCERTLGRSLTDSEKDCIHVDLENGVLVGNVSSPLSDLLKEKQAKLTGGNSPPPASIAGMTKYQYVAADGGPHLFLPSEAASAWQGVTSMTNVLDPKSDYGRACAATSNSEMAVIPVGSSSAIVLQNPSMSAWGKSSDGLVEIYDLKSWGEMNLDALIDRATTSQPTASLKDSGNVLQLNKADAFLLYAGDTVSSFAYGCYRVPIAAGKYKILVGAYSSNRDSVTVYRLQPTAN